MAMQTITVEMIPGDHVLLRIPLANASRSVDGKVVKQIFGQIDVSLQKLEDAITLRDVLSAFIKFQQMVALGTSDGSRAAHDAFQERFTSPLPADVAHEYGVGADHPRQELHAHLSPEEEERIRRELS